MMLCQAVSYPNTNLCSYNHKYKLFFTFFAEIVHICLSMCLAAIPRKCIFYGVEMYVFLSFVLWFYPQNINFSSCFTQTLHLFMHLISNPNNCILWMSFIGRSDKFYDVLRSRPISQNFVIFVKKQKPIHHVFAEAVHIYFFKHLAISNPPKVATKQ